MPIGRFPYTPEAYLVVLDDVRELVEVVALLGEVGANTQGDFTDTFSIDDDEPAFTNELTGFRPGMMPQRTSENGLRNIEELAAEFPNQRKDLLCPECGKAMVLKDGMYGVFYGCITWRQTGCRGSQNCNKKTAEPVGLAANQATKDKRKEAHAVFDRLWKEGTFTREQAYEWFGETMGLPDMIHIAMLNATGCDQLIKAARKKLGEVTRFDRITEEEDIV